MNGTSSLVRLTKLRELMTQRGFDAYMLLPQDEHFSEYVNPADRRCTYLSGFTGSACSIIVTGDKAALWTDGRYFIQAERELDADSWTLMKRGLPKVPSEAEWLVDNTLADASIGFDGRLLTYLEVTELGNELKRVESQRQDAKSQQAARSLIGCCDNLVDAIWIDRPARSSEPLRVVPLGFAGLTWQQKLGLVRQRMLEAGANLLIVSTLDDLAWLLNLRGSDFANTPLFYGHTIVRLINNDHQSTTTQDTTIQVDLFINPQSIDRSSHEINEHLSDASIKVQLHTYDQFFAHLTKLTRTLTLGDCVWLDVASSWAVVQQFASTNCRRLVAISPVSELKACKTPQEVDGLIEAHNRDSLLLCHYLAWLEQAVNAGTSSLGDEAVVNGFHLLPPHELSEMSAAAYLDALRRGASGSLGISFTTISCADANSALAHYTPSSQTNLPLSPSSWYLIDSGGQYETGTTDVTRVLHLGHKASAEQKRHYTVVLKAHIALSNQLFPRLTPGSRLDTVARRVLWQHKMDYAHGTGHGVGASLCVHEGPIGISGSRLGRLVKMGIDEPGLLPNMVLTIEPGYYLPNQYGIRLENAALVVPAGTHDDHNTIQQGQSNNNAASSLSNSSDSVTANEDDWLTFRPLTLVPFELDLIDLSLLSPVECQWIDVYHERIRETLSERIRSKGLTDLHSQEACSRCLAWIERKTEPIKKQL